MANIAHTVFPAIQDVTITGMGEKDEIDLKDESNNMVVSGNDQGYDIEINFSMIESLDPDGEIPEKQRLDLKGLVKNDPELNTFVYRGLKGFIEVEDVTVPESSEIPTYREGTITGIFLPWPKHFPDAPINEGGYGYGIYGDGDYPPTFNDGEYGFGNYGDGLYGE